MKFEKKFNYILSLVLTIWIIIFILFRGYQHIEPVSTICNFILEISIFALSFGLYKISKQKNKLYWLLFSISFIGVIVCNSNYTFLYLILKVDVASNLQVMLYIIPYFFFLFFQTIFWIKIISNFVINSKKKFLSVLCFLLPSLVVFTIYIIASLILIHHFVLITQYEMLLGAMDLVISNLIMLALICIRNKGFYLIALGLAMILTTNFWWMYLYHNKALGVKDYSSSFWLLALILVFFGLLHLVKVKNLILSSWFGSLQSIKSQITLWTFSLVNLSILALCFLGYSFNLITGHSIASLPFLIIIFSVVVILGSYYLGIIFEQPFKKIQHNIENLVTSEANTSLVNANFYTEEFIFLQNFIKDTFHLYQKRNQEKKAMGELALQVAHDIRSPVAAIMMLSKECNEIPEYQRISLRHAASRIQDIANYLLTQYAQQSKENSEISTFLASTAILSVLSEKRMEYKDKKISFTYDFVNVASFSFIEANIIEFKRMLSNIINNAAESIYTEGKIIIELNKINEILKISISDTGKGISKNTIHQLMNDEKITSNKVTGFGFGLTHAREILKKYDAKLEIFSQTNKGTEINLIFKIASSPIWITDEINFFPNDYIIVLDDDHSIHGAWEKLFSSYIDIFPNLTLNHFMYARDCIDYIETISDKNRILLLTDYELIKQEFDGLDVIKKTSINRSILVTSHYENHNIIKSAILSQTKILPKLLASCVKLKLKKFSMTDKENFREVDLIFIEDDLEFSEILSYLYTSKNKKIKIYNSPYNFLENIKQYSKKIKICLDFNLNCPVTGLDLAKVLYEKGYENLYLTTGFQMEQNILPHYITLLQEKIDLLNL